MSTETQAPPDLAALKERAKAAAAEVENWKGRIVEAERDAAAVESSAGEKMLAGMPLADAGGQIAAARAKVDAAKRALIAAQRAAVVATAERDLAAAAAVRADANVYIARREAQGERIQAFLAELAKEPGGLLVSVRLSPTDPDSGEAHRATMLEVAARRALAQVGAHPN